MITVSGSNPTALLAKIKKAIDDGHIETWTYDTDGDFTHATKDGQWKNKAWMSPSIKDDKLKFGFKGNKNVEVTPMLYGVYHGRFSEMLFAHFHSDFSALKLSDPVDTLKAPDKSS